MSLFTTLKRNAKSALRNHWGTALLVTILPFLTSLLLCLFMGTATRLLTNQFFGASSVYVPASSFSQFLEVFRALLPVLPAFAILCGLFAVMILLVLVPLYLGSLRWFFKLVQGEPEPLGSIFHFFETLQRYRRSIWLFLQETFRSVFWSIVFFVLPAALLCGLAVAQYRMPAAPQASLLFIMGSVLAGFLHLLTAALYVAYMNKYFLAEYFIADDDLMKPVDAIKKSIEYSKGYRFNLLWFTLSFIGWFLISPILPTLLYSMPYFMASQAMYALYLIETKKREQPTLHEFPPLEKEILQPEISAPPSPRSQPSKSVAADLEGVWAESAQPSSDGFRITEELAKAQLHTEKISVDDLLTQQEPMEAAPLEQIPQLKLPKDPPEQPSSAIFPRL